MAAMTSCENTQLINHDCPEAISTVKLRVDPGWFSHQLEVRICFYPRLRDLKLLVLELFHFAF